MSSTTQQTDVLIIGGGMVGMALACVLAKQGFEVAVLEEQAPQSFHAEQPLDLRVSALSLASETLLQAAGAWENVLAMRAVPFRRMRVWDRDGRGDTRFDSREIGEPFLGHIVENRIIQLALWQAAEGLDGVRLICPAEWKSFEIGAQGVKVQLADGSALCARLLVGADGAHSRVRSLANIGVTQWDYDVDALVVTVRTHAPQQDITWQRFTSSGPQALLPLPGQHASLVWYHTADEVTRLLALDEDEFLRELQRAFPWELGEIEKIQARGRFKLTRRHAQSYVKPRLVLAGDAAHTIHPLAGQGVNLGFMGAAALAEVLIEARARGEDIGSLPVLQRYARMRRGENLVMQTGMDVLHHAFKPKHGAMPLLRNLLLHAAQNVPPLRRMLTRRATGRAGDVPRVAQTGRF